MAVKNVGFESMDRMSMHDVIKQDLRNNETFMYFAGNGNFFVGGEAKEVLLLALNLMDYLQNDFIKELAEGISNERRKQKSVS